MATGMAPNLANEILQGLDGTAQAILDSLSGDPYVQLHTAEPGAAGGTAIATETTRQQASLGAAAGGAISNDADIAWTTVAGSEDYTHFSLWSASTGGTFLWSGTVTANAVTAGDNFTIASGDLDLTIGVAS